MVFDNNFKIIGAGKTTLISILTGLYESSSGEATIAGFNVKTESADVYKCIGICPQVENLSILMLV